ncbi:MAG TPA: class I SAM-dependent methyltransferase [Candidatus Scalindua sp.]|nr:class I SAM-dependent methyltransferase [Candidatus Scalindua sp.]
MLCYGIDISEVTISMARKYTNAHLICKSLEDGLPYEDNFFDYITCLGSLEHFHNQPLVIREISRTANNECRICILVPDDNYVLHKFGYETDGQLVVNRHTLVWVSKITRI